MFLGKGVLIKCSKVTGEHPCRSVISIKLLCKATLLKSFSQLFENACGFASEITLRHGCSPINFLHILGKFFDKNTSEELLL